jgi:hypothetical protein
MSLHLAAGVGSSLFQTGLTLGMVAIGASCVNVHWQKQSSPKHLFTKLVDKLAQANGVQVAAELAELHAFVKAVQEEKVELLAQAETRQATLSQAQAELAQANLSCAQLREEATSLQKKLTEQEAAFQSAQTSHAEALAALQAQLTETQAQLEKALEPSMFIKIARLGWKGAQYSWKGSVSFYRWYVGAPNPKTAGDVAVAK